MITARNGLFLAALLLAGCSSPPPPGGAIPPNPTRTAKGPLSLVDTVPEGQRCIVSGGKEHPLTLTTPRLVDLVKYGPDTVVDCFGDGYFRQRKAVRASNEPRIALRIAKQGTVDPAFGPDIEAQSPLGGKTYPKWIRIRLHRNYFDTAAERDSYYAAEAVQLDQGWDEIERRMRRECGENRKAGTTGVILLSPECRTGLQILKDRRAADRAALEVNRRQSTIR